MHESKCNLCDLSFLDEWKLNRHKENVHKTSSPPKNFKCKKCYYRTFDSYHINRHIERCTGDTPAVGRPKEIQPCTYRTVLRETTKTLQYLNDNPALKNSIAQKISSDENVEINEADAINMITDVNLSDRQAIKVNKFMKQRLDKGI